MTESNVIALLAPRSAAAVGHADDGGDAHASENRVGRTHSVAMERAVGGAERCALTDAHTLMPLYQCARRWDERNGSGDGDVGRRRDQTRGGGGVVVGGADPCVCVCVYIR